VLLVESGGEPEIGELDVSTRIDENVVGFDIAAESVCQVVLRSTAESQRSRDSPMDET
jgi:hypothetical protein